LRAYPPLLGSLGRLVGPTLGKEVDLKLCTRGGLRGTPLGLLPPLGREGVPLTTTDDFQTTQKLRISTVPKYSYHPRKKILQHLVKTLLPKKRDHRGYSFDYSQRNISFFFYEYFCTDPDLLTRKFDIAHTGIPDNDHLGG
jgi:hypothetical protein